MKPLLAPFTLAALVIGIAALQPVHARDGKILSATACQPYSTTTLPSELSFRAHGLKNISTNAEYVVCGVPIDTDTPTIWTDSFRASVYVGIHASASGTARCELYLGSNLAGQPVTFFREQVLLAGDVLPVPFTGISASGVDHNASLAKPAANLYCRLPPGASIIQIEVIEEAFATDGDQ